MLALAAPDARPTLNASHRAPALRSGPQRHLRPNNRWPAAGGRRALLRALHRRVDLATSSRTGERPRCRLVRGWGATRVRRRGATRRGQAPGPRAVPPRPPLRPRRSAPCRLARCSSTRLCRPVPQQPLGLRLSPLLPLQCRPAVKHLQLASPHSLPEISLAHSRGSTTPPSLRRSVPLSGWHFPLFRPTRAPTSPRADPCSNHRCVAGPLHPANLSPVCATLRAWAWQGVQLLHRSEPAMPHCLQTTSLRLLSCTRYPLARRPPQRRGTTARGPAPCTQSSRRTQPRQLSRPNGVEQQRPRVVQLSSQSRVHSHREGLLCTEPTALRLQREAYLRRCFHSARGVKKSCAHDGRLTRRREHPALVLAPGGIWRGLRGCTASAQCLAS